ATLVLRVDGGRGLEVEFAARQIIERINAYFGYAAVGALRILQAPIAQDPPARGAPAPARPSAPPPPELGGIGDGALRAALARLGAGVRDARSAQREARS